jgi:pimeloyl-ACP methyl ester carboxylesterase
MHDFLFDAGISENNFTLKDLPLLTKSDIGVKTYYASSALLNLGKVYPDEDSDVVYAAAELESSADADLGIEAAVEDGLMLWINGKLATPGSAGRTTRSYYVAGMIHLRRGTNRILAKVNRKSENWTLLLNFISVQQARQIIAQQSSGNLLTSHLVKPGDPIHVLLPDGCYDQVASVHISNSLGELIYSYSLSELGQTLPALPTLSEDYYSIVTHSLCGAMTDSFYVGDPHAVYEKILKLRDTKRLDSGEYLDIDALVARFTILTSADYSRPSDQNWQRKILMILRDGTRAIRAPIDHSWAMEPGLHFREYVSPIDGTHRHYLICVPTFRRQQVPLILMPPTLQQPARPFLESTLVNNMDVLDRLQAAAESSQVIVAKFGDRGNLYDAPIGEAELHEVLSDVSDKFDIDTRKVYLLGHSESGRNALLMAEHAPELFAGIGTYGALTRPFPGDESHSEWSRHDNVRALAANLRNVPTILMNGDRDTTNTLQSTRLLYRLMRKRDVPAALQVWRYGTHLEPFTEGRLIALLLARNSLPHRAIHYSLPRLSHPTIAKAFSDPFMVVVGTAKGNQAQALEVANAFSAMWKKEFFAAPRIKMDVDLNSEDIQQFNIVLIGIPDINSVLSIDKNLSTRVRQTVLLPQEVANSTSVQEVFVLPNPVNSQKYLVDVDITWEIVNSADFIPALTGFYDYAFWTATDEVLKRGMFDQKQFSSLSTIATKPNSVN